MQSATCILFKQSQFINYIAECSQAVCIFFNSDLTIEAKHKHIPDTENKFECTDFHNMFIVLHSIAQP